MKKFPALKLSKDYEVIFEALGHDFFQLDTGTDGIPGQWLSNES